MREIARRAQSLARHLLQARDARLQIAPGGRIDGLTLRPGETFDLKTRGRGGAVELSQIDAPQKPARIVIRTEAAPAAAAATGAAARAAMGAEADGPTFVRPGFFSGPINFADDNFSPEVTLKYQANEDFNIFASFKTGF